MTLTLAIVAGGAMGSAVARRLTRNGLAVLTSLDGRGPESRARSEAAGMRHADDAEIAARADLFLSIVPPAEARALAQRFAGPIRAAGRAPDRPLVYADCNAVGVADAEAIARTIEAAGGVFCDAAIVGLPPRDEEPGPTFYACGRGAEAMAGLGAHGIAVARLDAPVGAAKALKLSYAGITKGLTAVAATMILAAERAGAGEALKRELAASQPELLARFGRTLPDMVPKAYRWVEEMRAIAGFVGPDFPESGIYEGAAELYGRLARDREGGDGGGELEALAAFLRR